MVGGGGVFRTTNSLAGRRLVGWLVLSADITSNLSLQFDAAVQDIRTYLVYF